ncbi:MAG TPA: peptide chain release factor N(5)-glutamine methyltransferase [Thermodesulfovibrionales bacterium]|nr:peptide chain release factor N(5)-glutamine methyltransferase [Thermodesulfovibrionales bacterium]
MRALEGVREVSAFLRDCGIADSQKEAEAIISDYAGVGKIALYRDNPTLSACQEEEIYRVLKRRQAREPLQYIVGLVDFYGLKIKVGPGVLIPRHETELIVEEAIKTLKLSSLCVTSENRNALRILDLCTGSGCLALALAKEVRNSQVTGIDISEKALEYAALNATINGITNVTFIKGDLYEPVYGSRFDLIVSNPPYIKRSEINHLPPEIRTWEPVSALDGGEDGLLFYRGILSRSSDYLADDGSLIMELGHGEAAAVMELAKEAGLKPVSLVKDYAGIERILHVKQAK